MALYRCRAARRLGARTGIDPTAQKLKADQIHGSKRGCPTGCRTEGPDGRAGRGRSNGGQDERLPNLRLQIMVPDGGAGQGDGWQNLWLKIKMSGGRANGGGKDEHKAERNARRVPDGVPNMVPGGCPTGGPTGPDGVPDGSHVIGHVIFECHVTRLRWQGVILLPTLLSQR
jgi:hypothetical protein